MFLMFDILASHFSLLELRLDWKVLLEPVARRKEETLLDAQVISQQLSHPEPLTFHFSIAIDLTTKQPAVQPSLSRDGRCCCI